MLHLSHDRNDNRIIKIKNNNLHKIYYDNQLLPLKNAQREISLMVCVLSITRNQRIHTPLTLIDILYH